MRKIVSRRFAAATLGYALLAGAGPASAQTPNSNINPALDCANHGGCTVKKYGLTHPDDLAFPIGEPIAGNGLSKSHESFKGSYFYRRNQSDPRIDLGECIAEAAFVPLEGTVLLRERNDCIPPALPATGQCRSCPGAPAGCTNGTTCSSGWDCDRGICNNLDVGCPVEIATDIGTPGIGNVFQSYFQTVAPALYVATAFNGTLATDGDHLFAPPLPPHRAGIGRRFIRPAGGTVLYWIDLVNGGGNTTGENQSVLFCDDELGGAICNAATPRFNKYPVITQLPDLAREGRNEAPFIFPGDNILTAAVEGDFDTDQTYAPPGQIYGNCTNPIPFPIPGLPTPQILRQGCSAPGALARTQCDSPGVPRPCCTGPGTGPTCGPADSNALCTGNRLPWFCCTGNQTGNCGTECVVAPGVDTGPCNLADRGVRFNRDHSSDDLGSPDPEKCNANPFRFRGSLNRNCSVVVFYNECLQLPHNEACTSNGIPFPCCTGAGTGTCGTAQTCFLRGKCANNPAIVCDNNAANGNECGGVNVCNLGRTGRCSVSTAVRCSPGESPYPKTEHGFLKWGDPHPRIGLVNFGPQTRPDMDCDGVEDFTIDNFTNGTTPPSGPPDGLADTIGDACPYYSETNTVDTNPSPLINTYNHDNAAGVTGGRADECECGDSSRNGLVNVADIVDINTKIFNPPGIGQPGAGTANLYAPLSDANEDDAWNVSDIVAVNLDIFSAAQTSRCGRSPLFGN